ncbi:MAG TPA: VacJ family lipoprotein [Desulfomonilaceae bacterium]|nr:VacJ family lipoprotein [Desulfomonilaceae bacterium]
MKSSCEVLITFLIFFLLSLFSPTLGVERFSRAGSPCLAITLAEARATDGEEKEPPEPFGGSSKTEYASDPLEPMNRVFFQFNDKLYFWFIKPASKIYATFIPPGLRVCIRNGFENLRFPTRFLNNLLQGKFKEAGIETGRFLINTTIGFAGFFEIASRDFNLPAPRDLDTAQTLAFYGLKPGLYLVWPFLGPSSLRDSFGMAGDTALSPIFWLPQDLWVSVAIRAGIIVNNTSLRIGEYEDFKKAALDPYASMRQAYLQYRENQILK